MTKNTSFLKWNQRSAKRGLAVGECVSSQYVIFTCSLFHILSFCLSCCTLPLPTVPAISLINLSLCTGCSMLYRERTAVSLAPCAFLGVRTPVVKERQCILISCLTMLIGAHCFLGRWPLAHAAGCVSKRNDTQRSSWFPPSCPCHLPLLLSSPPSLFFPILFFSPPPPFVRGVIAAVDHQEEEEEDVACMNN